MSMSTSPTGPASGVPLGDTAASTGAASTGMASLLAPNTFLNLLVSELRYQDPLDPTSSANFMSQLAQLSQVEQLQSVSQSSDMGAATSLIGRTITGTDATGTVVTGAVTGVTNGTNGPTLDVGSSVVTLSSVTQVGSA